MLDESQTAVNEWEELFFNIKGIYIDITSQICFKFTLERMQN